MQNVFSSPCPIPAAACLWHRTNIKMGPKCSPSLQRSVTQQKVKFFSIPLPLDVPASQHEGGTQVAQLPMAPLFQRFVVVDVRQFH